MRKILYFIIIHVNFVIFWGEKQKKIARNEVRYGLKGT